MKSQVVHTVWCYISGKTAGEIWNWSLLEVKGFKGWGGQVGLLKGGGNYRVENCGLGVSSATENSSLATNLFYFGHQQATYCGFLSKTTATWFSRCILHYEWHVTLQPLMSSLCKQAHILYELFIGRQLATVNKSSFPTDFYASFSGGQARRYREKHPRSIGQTGVGLLCRAAGPPLLLFPGRVGLEMVY